MRVTLGERGQKYLCFEVKICLDQADILDVRGICSRKFKKKNHFTVAV